MDELIKRIDEDFESSPVDGVCVLSINDWTAIKKNLNADRCRCVIKLTEVPGLNIIYPKVECPVHGHLHCLHI